MESVIQRIRASHGEEVVRELGLSYPSWEAPPFVDISPYNTNTFPKEGRWKDQKGRAWVYQGPSGIFDVKVFDRGMTFPGVGETVDITRRVPKLGTWTLSAHVECVFLQTPEVRGEWGSRAVARAQLSCRRFTFLKE